MLLPHASSLTRPIVRSIQRERRDGRQARTRPPGSTRRARSSPTSTTSFSARSTTRGGCGCRSSRGTTGARDPELQPACQLGLCPTGTWKRGTLAIPMGSPSPYSDATAGLAASMAFAGALPSSPTRQPSRSCFSPVQPPASQIPAPPTRRLPTHAARRACRLFARRPGCAAPAPAVRAWKSGAGC